ncbi:hypothetical protein CANMA_000264 [Candida margitis]|uniref:uncharacterized protein n=1 Tax=Candida margitis TaxID=1775924 RepID=UPI002226023D|nr:uncharacterized protein CANMA_000264 [Candida margitis]KAI5970673.1 hypothetical protein CANMA_000264 [Candida margitis]
MSSVESTERIEILSSNLERNIETFKSAHDILDLSKDLLQDGSTPEPAQVRLSKRNYIIDSFNLEKTHKQYKNWENETRLAFIKEDIVSYNQVVAKIANVNQKLDESSNSYEVLAKNIKIPDFTISIKTLENYGDEELLELGRSYQTANLQLVQLFSLNAANENKLFPDFQVIQELINIEFRLRVEKRVHLEILMSMKNKIQTQNKSWTVRDNQLREFIDIKVQQMIETVEKANAEDNKARGEEEEEEEDDDDDDEDEDEEEEEEEVVRELDSDDGDEEDGDGVEKIEDDGEAGKMVYEMNIENKEDVLNYSEADAHRELDASVNEIEPNQLERLHDNYSQTINTPVESGSEDDEMLIDH